MHCRLQDCLSTSSLALLAAAIPAGCSCLQKLDLSCNALGASAATTTCSSSHAHSSITADTSSSEVDQAWASFADALAQPAPCCPQLQSLVLSRCSLGPAAGAALSKVLRAKSRSNLQQLHLAQCAGMGEVSNGLNKICQASAWAASNSSHMCLLTAAFPEVLALAVFTRQQNPSMVIMMLPKCLAAPQPFKATTCLSACAGSAEAAGSCCRQPPQFACARPVRHSIHGPMFESTDRAERQLALAASGMRTAAGAETGGKLQLVRRCSCSVGKAPGCCAWLESAAQARPVKLPWHWGHR